MATGTIHRPDYSTWANALSPINVNSFDQISSGGGLKFYVVAYTGSDSDAPITNSGTWWWNVIVMGTTNRMTQIATIIYSSNRNEMWFRVRHDTNWFGWYKLTGQ